MFVKLNNFPINYIDILHYIQCKYDNNINLILKPNDTPDLQLYYVNNLTNLDKNNIYITELYLDENMDDSNILSMYYYFNILGCNIDNMDMSQLSYISCVVYNFILLNSNLERKGPIVLDIISSVYYLIKNKVSLSRFGDGEIGIMSGCRAPYNEDPNKFLDTYNDILNRKSENLMIGLVDVFYDASSNYWVANESKYWFTKNKWKNRMLKVIPKTYHNSLYLCANISRNQHYLNFNTGLYYEFFAKIFMNKNIVVIANKDKIYNTLLPSFLFPSRKITFIVCKDIRCSDDEDFIYEKCIALAKGKLTLAFAGLYATKIAYKLSLLEDYQCIDSGSFNYLKANYNNDFIYQIQNILYLFFYTIIESKINYTIVDDYTLKEVPYIINDNLPLSINFDYIDNKLIPNSNQFKLHFNLPIYLYQFDTVLCLIHIKTNQRCSLFTGYTLIEFNGEYKDTLLFNFKNFKWYISPSFDENRLIINNCILKIIKIC